MVILQCNIYLFCILFLVLIRRNIFLIHVYQLSPIQTLESAVLDPHHLLAILASAPCCWILLTPRYSCYSITTSLLLHCFSKRLQATLCSGPCSFGVGRSVHFTWRNNLHLFSCWSLELLTCVHPWGTWSASLCTFLFHLENHNHNYLWS